MNCLLTGGSGIVGSHIIFEWLHKAIVEKTVNHLYVVLRDNEKTAEQRLLAILQNESRPAFLNAFTLEACLEKITVISNDLSTITKSTLEKTRILILLSHKIEVAYISSYKEIVLINLSLQM